MKLDNLPLFYYRAHIPIENNNCKVGMMGQSNCHPAAQHLKEQNWYHQPLQPLCFQSRVPPPSYSCMEKVHTDVTPGSPPPPYTANSSNSSTFFSSRLLTILTLAILLLTSLSIGLLWKHLELLASLGTNLPPASTPLQSNHPTLPALPDDLPPLPKLPT